MGEAFVVSQQTEVIGHAAEGHVGLGHHEWGPAEAIGVEVFFGLFEHEGREMHGVGEAVVEAATVVDDVAHHP